LLLNTKNEIIMIEDISVGILNNSLVHPREVFCTAVKKSACSLIAVHNHPSGNPMPSKADIDVTKRLSEAGELLGIKVLDHLIIGDGTYVSLKEKLLM
jgi:DNA repair protein RadC